MDVARYINIIFAIIVWLAVFILIKPQRIKALLPLGMLAAIVLFGVELYFKSLGLHKYNNPFLPVAGIPLFHLFWGAGSGIIFINYMKREFSKKLIIIMLFTILTGIFAYISDMIGNHANLKGFNDFYHIILNFATLSFLTWASEGLFGKRIYENTINID